MNNIAKNKIPTLSRIKMILLSCSIVFSLSCKDSEKHPEAGTDPVSKCLMAKDYRYEELLTKTDIAKHVTIDESSYKMSVSSIKGVYGSCSYEWLSNRPDLEIEVSGQVIKGPDKNRVKLTKLDFYTDKELQLYKHDSAISLFDQSYKKLSQQEYNELLANLKKEYANSEADFKQAKGFLDQRMKFTFEPVQNLGDRAYWKWNDTYGLELVVLSGVAHFTIETKLSAKAESSLEAAVKFAKEVLAKCKS